MSVWVYSPNWVGCIHPLGVFTQNAMREFDAFFDVKTLCLSLTREFDAWCVIFTHSVNFTLTIFIGFSRFLRVGIEVALLGLSPIGDNRSRDRAAPCIQDRDPRQRDRFQKKPARQAGRTTPTL